MIAAQAKIIAAGEANAKIERARGEAEIVRADYFSEEVRRLLVAQFGEKTVLGGGLAVKTSLDSRMQDAATSALRRGLIAYDRHNRGWRGPVTRRRRSGSCGRLYRT